MTVRVLQLLGNVQLLFFTGVLFLFFARQCNLSPINNSRLYESPPSISLLSITFSEQQHGDRYSEQNPVSVNSSLLFDNKDRGIPYNRNAYTHKQTGGVTLIPDVQNIRLA